MLGLTILAANIRITQKKAYVLSNQEIYLLLGTNLGDRAANLRNATQRIEQAIGPVADASSWYETAAWGVHEQPSFYNQVVRVATVLSHEPLLRTLQAIEQQLGKVKLGHWRARLIDLDILYYGHRRVCTPFLTLPHPEVQNRRFTLVPLCEIAPQFVHPVLGKTQVQLLEECADELEVKMVD